MMDVKETLDFYTIPTILLAAFLASVTSALCILILRLYLHPLRKVPGPWIAGVTSWYEFYYDVFCGETYIKKITQLHRSYNSPVIRISPNHVHVNEPDLYREIYRMGGEYIKAPYFYETLGVLDGIATITDPEKHRFYRNILSPIFSTKAADAQAPRMLSTIERAGTILIQRGQIESGINVTRLYSSITADVICETFFGQSQNLIESKEGENDILANMDLFTSQVMLGKHFPFLKRIGGKLLPALGSKVAPGYVTFRQQCEAWVKDVKARRATKESCNDKINTTIFDALLEHDLDNADAEGHLDKLVDQAFTFLVAGTDSTAYTMACATYYILRSPRVLETLLVELDAAQLRIGGKFDWNRARRLTYLTAIVKETMRISPPAPGGLPRVVPAKGLYIGPHYIPSGTIISEGAYAMHYNEEIYPEPEKFMPERWLDGDSKKLEKGFVPFSKGARGCIGINAAYMEMYLCLAYFFSRFEMELLNTDDHCVQWVDHGVARPNAPVLVKVLRDRLN